MAEIIAALQRCGLSAHAAAELSAGAISVQLRAGEQLFRAGQSADDFVAFLGDGTIIEVTTADWEHGVRRSIQIKGPYTLPVGYFARFLNGGMRSADVRIIAGGEVIYVAFEAWSNNAECLRHALAAWINGDERHL